MKYIKLVILLMSLSGFGITAHAQTNNDEPITVVELFTSQGCYSCPPADALLAKLEQKNTITLSCHVSYWNHLGWKDTFSKTYCDNRQRTYQSTLEGNRGVYTPQMVINGRFGTVGSRERTVGQAIQFLQKENRIKPVELSVADGDRLSINLPTLVADQALQLLLVGTRGTETVPINRGENGGKTLDYHNPVERVENLGRWDGQAKTVIEKLPAQESIKQWLVLAQAWPVGEIVAAGKITLN